MANQKRISEVIEAIDQIASAIERLRTLKVIRSRKFYEDFAEWLVAQIFRGTLAASKIQRHWDVQCNGECVQVRSHWKATDNFNRWSNTSGTYDVLAIVVFDQSLRVCELYRVAAVEVGKLRGSDGRLRWDALAKWRLYPGDMRIPTALRPLFAS